MSKFVRVEVGSRGLLERIDEVNLTFEQVVKKYTDKVQEFLEDEDYGEDYVDEWCTIEEDEYRGLISYSTNEEESVYFIEVYKYEDLCKFLVDIWENDGDVDSVVEYVEELFN